jgi:hypothetical protein
MRPAQIYAVFSNIEPDGTALVLEELAVTAQKEGMFESLLLDRMDGIPYHSGEWAQHVNHPWKKAIKRAVWGRIPYLPLDLWGAAFKSLKTGESSSQMERTIFFLTCSEKNLPAFSINPPSFLFLLHPDAESVSFVYRLLQKMKILYTEIPLIEILIYGIPRIENAAIRFQQFKKEISALFDTPIPMKFCSHISPNEEKIRAAAYPFKAPLVDHFPEDAFHGQMKRAAKACMESIATKSDDTGFWALVAEVGSQNS